MFIFGSEIIGNYEETNLRSFLQPTRSTGVCGQKRLISGYHIAWQLRSDTGLVIEKHSNTTSDLKFDRWFKLAAAHKTKTVFVFVKFETIETASLNLLLNSAFQGREIQISWNYHNFAKKKIESYSEN